MTLKCCSHTQIAQHDAFDSVTQVGERIRVILDCDDNTLAFERNYEFLGVAFRGASSQFPRMNRISS